MVPHWLLLLETPPVKDATGEDKALVESYIAVKLMHDWGRKRPKEMMTVLLSLLDDTSPVIRRSAARSLGATATESPKSKQIARGLNVGKSLSALLDDPDQSVRFAATVALGRLKE